MASGDFNKKIQGIAKDLCFDPNAPMGPQLQNFSDGIRQMAFTIANELDPINTPTPPNLDSPPLDWQMPDLPDGFDGGMPSDGGWGGDGGDVGGGWGQDGEDGIGGEPGNDGIDGNDGQDGIDAEAGRGCIVPATTPTGITGMSGGQPGTGVAMLTSVHTKAAADEKIAFNDAIEDANGVDAGGPFGDVLVWGEVANAVDTLFTAQEPTMKDPTTFNKDTVVAAYNISSQEVTAGKNILLGKDDEGKYWVLVESCDDDE